MSPTLSRSCRLFLAVALLGTAGHSLAASYCVDSSEELRAALAAAAASDEDDTIRLVRGDYPLDTSLSAFSIRGGLVLRGGYANGCPLLGRTVDPFTTRIFGAGVIYPAVTLTANDSLEIDGLHFDHLSGVRLSSAGGQSSPPVSLSIRRSRFANSVMGLQITSSRHNVRIENNLFLDTGRFDGNESDALAIIHDSANSAAISVDVIFNTLLGNSRGILVRGGGPFDGTPRVQNNIIVSDLSGTAPFTLKADAAQVAATNNIWGEVVFANGGSLAANLLNLVADPQLDSGLVPMAGSPALNSGTAFVAGGVPTTDHDGGPRTIGSLPDRGALESPISDIDTIVVTSTASSGPGTLRQAILDSNQTVNAERIEFDLGAAAGCPYFISLSTLLPVVTSPLTIDGFSQPGSSPNTRDDRYDGVHCVVLNGSLSEGLRLQPPANQVIKVQGIAFQRFAEAGIEVDGPGRVIISGNTFGVSTNPLVPAGFLGDAISIIGTVQSDVGGYYAESSNLISNAAGAGLRMTDCVACRATNNFIGVRPNGYSALGNGVGILAVGGSGGVQRNVIGHSATQGLRIEGAEASYMISGNVIGESRVPIPLSLDRHPAPNGTNGIRLIGGGAHYVHYNTIAHNGTDGLVVLDAVDDAGLFYNRIYANGQLGIDLSPDGVDPQDSDLVDNGAGNGGQNYPVLESADGSNGSGVVAGYLPSSTGRFRLEFFASENCDDSGHGEGEMPVGLHVVEIGGIPLGEFGAIIPIDANIPFEADVTAGLGFGLIGRYITATATRLRLDDASMGNSTSEFSACIEYLPGPELFRDGFEG